MKTTIRKNPSFTIVLFCWGSLLGAPADRLELASPFAEHMVLQRQQSVPIWGWGEPGNTVTVSVAGQKASTPVGGDGRWRCDLPPLKAGGPHVFTVSDGTETIRFTDVLVGEVWICCGQSNMEMGHNKVPEINKLVKETLQAGRPVHCLEVQKMISFSEEERCRAQWKCRPPDSAVAAAFACLLQVAGDVPVAVVVTSWGSSSIEGWMPADMTAKLPHFKKIMEAHNADRALSQMIIETATASDGTIKRYCENPQEHERLTQAHRNANIYARTRPNMLYNAMLHPLIPMACRGMVYYQGEANTKSHEDMVQYRTTQRLWLERLRQAWNRPDFHLLSVMLPGFGRTLKSGPGWGDLEAVNAHSWAVMRDSQLGILDLPATGVANTIDLGDEKNIHPGDKLPIAERLVLLARRDTLGETALLASGPMLESVSVKGSEVTIRFTNATGLQTVDGEAPRAFWASEDGEEWHAAAARIVDETVVLSVPAGVQPGQVRYAYAAMPKVNLVNEAGLPAYPFSFDVEN